MGASQAAAMKGNRLDVHVDLEKICQSVCPCPMTRVKERKINRKRLSPPVHIPHPRLNLTTTPAGLLDIGPRVLYGPNALEILVELRFGSYGSF